MSGFFYYGEQSGARILRGNTGTTQLTEGGSEAVLMHAKTWDWIPAGPIGDAVFREASVVVKAENGVAFTITPSVDEEDLLARSFSILGNVTRESQAPMLERGTRAAVEFEMTSRSGDVELEDIVLACKPLRATP